MNENIATMEEPEEIPLDLKIDMNMAKKLTLNEARFTVSRYYDMQQKRIQFGNKLLALKKAGEPHAIAEHFKNHFAAQEKYIGSLLATWAKQHDLPVWAMQICGVGPVIAAGLFAHIKMQSSPSKVWRFAGLDPTVKWVKDEVRPWNAKLKMLTAYKLGESFVKVNGNPRSLYGRLYRERKDILIARNEAGEFADDAARILTEKNWDKRKDAYKAYIQGKFPPAHVHARARRHAVKIFLVHYWGAMWLLEHPGETKPPNPWIIEHGGHVDLIDPEVPYPTK